jgi:hypothetical protein
MIAFRLLVQKFAPTKHHSHKASTKILPTSTINGEACSIRINREFSSINVGVVIIGKIHSSAKSTWRLDPPKLLPVGSTRHFFETVADEDNLEDRGFIIVD